MGNTSQKLLKQLRNHIISEPTTALDFAEEVLDFAKDQNDNDVLIESYYLYGLSLWENGNFNETLKYFELANNVIRKESSPTLQAYAKSALAIMYAMSYENNKAYRLIEEALEVEELIDDYHCLITLYSRIGGAYIKLSLFTEGLSILLKATTLLKEIPQFKEEGYIYSHLSIIHSRIKNHDEAIACSKKAEWIFDTIGNHTMGIIAVLVNRSLIHEDNQDESKESIESLTRAKELCSTDPNRFKNTISLIHSNLSFEYSKNSVKNYQEALNNIEIAYKIAVENNIKNLICISLSQILRLNSILKKDIPDYLIEKFQHEEEIVSYILEFLPIVNDLLIERRTLKNIIDYYVNIKSFEKAFLYQTELTAVNDKIYEKEIKENLSALSLKYETYKKELELKQLKIEHKELELRQKEELEKINQNLEQSIKERTSELILKNNELEQYAYIVAHDLKEPIRSIVSFSQLIEKRAKNELSDSTKDLFQFVIGASYNMREMVDDLLQFSTIKIEKESYTHIDVNQLLELVFLNLRNNIEESNVKIITQDFPITIKGDRTRIKQLYQNLISNAIKFRRPDDTLTIKVGGQQIEDKYTFTVADNGIGIKEEFHKKIFKIFKRLHTKDKFKGSGIGLSVCQKIVEQHGGDIWVTSNEEGGTTFHFTLE